MKRIFWTASITALFFSAVLFAQAGPARNGGDRGAGMMRGAFTNQTQTYTGKIDSITTSAKRMMDQIKFTTATGSIWLQMGPAKFLTDQGIKLQKGDALTLEGFAFTNKEAVTVIVKTMTYQGKKIEFFDTNNRPKWAANGRMGQGRSTNKSANY